MHLLDAQRIAWFALCTAAAAQSALAEQQGAPLPPAPAAQAVSVADAFRKMSSDSWVSRSVSLADLGMPPLVLGIAETSREIALPVPPNVALANATLQMDASFVRAEGGRTTLILSVDGFPSSARPVAAERGDGSITLAVDGTPRPTGLVRFNIDWRTAVARENTCTDARTPGNLLRIEPTTRLTYRFDAATLQDLPAAWAALPATPIVLVTSGKLSAQAYETAWRLGVALERAGKHPRIRTLPAVGDVVDLQNINVPAVLKRIPAFAALAEGGKRKLRDAAEVGALLALGAAGPLQVDFVVGDRSIRGVLAQALDALRVQIPSEGAEAFAEWRERALDGWAGQLASGQVRVANVFGRPAIVVAQDAGADAAALFSQAGQAPGAATVAIGAADDPRADVAAVSLKYIGAKPATLDVASHADWTAGFHIGSLASDGRLPSALVIDVSAAPGASRSAPVASVFLNDVLLAARELDANGRRERIMAPIPRHALSAQNTIRVSFVRQPASDRCREMPEAYPVSVLASSHVILDKVEAGPDFSGLITRFASGANVLVPVAYLQDAANTLPRAISLAASTGISPSRSRFDAVADDGPHKMKGPFLALDVPLKDVDSELKVEAGRLYLASAERPLMDLAGLQRAGVVEVVKQGGVAGALYRTIGTAGPAPDRAFQLSQGNVAVIGSAGLRAEINTWDPTGQAMLGTSRATLPAGRYMWALWLLVLAFLAGIAAYGVWYWRRRAAAVKS
jgi:hypothetical protein